MKKYLFIAIAAVATMAACTRVEILENNTPDTLISFNVVSHLAQTKAYNGLQYPTSVPFGTYAWWTPENEDWTGIAQDTTYVFMANQKVAYTNGTWSPTTAYYWTKTGKITFASYSPYTLNGQDNGYSEIPVYNIDNGFVIKNYSIVSDTNVDLMYANLAENCHKDHNSDGKEVLDSLKRNPSESGFSGVPTVFNHALCQIGFEFRALGRKNPNVDTIAVDVHNVYIDNIDKFGSFTQHPAPFTNRWNTPHYPDTTAVTANYVFGTPADSLSLPLIPDSLSNVTTNYKALKTRRILLPQELATNYAEKIDTTHDQKLVVRYTIKMHYTSVSDTIKVDSLGYWATEQALSAVRLNNGTITAWKENQNITYRISINPYAADPITFDPAVAKWDDIYSTDINLNEND